MTQPFDVITSPGFPQDYQNGIDCTWNILLPVGQLIQFNFLHFDLEHSLYSCSWVILLQKFCWTVLDKWLMSITLHSVDFRGDSLTIFDGSSNTSPMLAGPYCGDSLPPSQISSSNNLFIYFHSNFYYTETGFKLEYNSTSKNPNKIDICTNVFVSRLLIKKLLSSTFNIAPFIFLCLLDTISFISSGMW